MPRSLPRTAEAALIGLFFIQALRYLIGQLYARVGSASLFPALNPDLIDPALPGLVEPATITNEMIFLGYVLVLPLLTVLIGRFRLSLVAAAVIAAAGRYLMTGTGDIAAVIAPAIVIGGGLMYIAVLVRHRARTLPYMLIFALALDQLYRALGDTLDPSWAADYTNIQLGLSTVAVLLAIYNFVIALRAERGDERDVSPERGLMTFWGGIGLGAMLFLQLSLLSLPNAVAGRADTTYTLVVPALMVATLLPLVPWVRGQARGFISLFDSSVRGWSWMLLIALLIVFGTRFQGIAAGVALILAQFAASLVWWWLARPQGEKERNLGGVWIVFGIIIFALLVTFDIFTYEYAFVRDFAPEFESLNAVIPPLLRGFRGLGLGVILLGVFLALLPMVQTHRRIAWAGTGNTVQSVLMLVITAGFGAGAFAAAQPPIIRGLVEPETIRAGTYNIHAGYNEFFYYDLEAIAQTIEGSGADVVLLQEIEAGRLTSFGVDQPLWLARRLGMDRRFFPTNEGLQGLAVLSEVEIVFDDGELLDSISSQTGLQRVQIRPDAGVITIYNTWLEPLLDTGGTQTIEDLERGQRAQLNQIFGIISAHHAPDGRLGRTIIGGTFNNVPDSPLIQQVSEAGFVDQFIDFPLERAATYWRTGERARLDYIWTAGNMQTTGRLVIDSSASDHRLAVIELLLQ